MENELIEFTSSGKETGRFSSDLKQDRPARLSTLVLEHPNTVARNQPVLKR